MTLTEQKFWDLIKDHLPGDASRVENLVDNGMPDISGCFAIDYWIELKVCPNKEKHRSVLSMLRDSQIVWNLRRGKTGSLIFVLVKYTNFIVIYKYEQKNFTTIDKLEHTYVELGIIFNKQGYNWEKFKKILIKEIKERILEWCTLFKNKQERT